MADKISVGKKKKIIAGAIAGAVVLAGAGVGVGVGLTGGGQDPAPEYKFELVLGGGSTIDTVYSVNGEEIKVEDLKPGDVIQFPKPAETFVGQDDAKEYFVGWATNREASTPDYFVGEETLEITEEVESLHAIYMTASYDNLTFTEVDQETCTVAYNDVAVDEERGGLLVIPNEYQGRRVVAVNAGETIATALETIANTDDDTVKTAQRTLINETLAAMQNKASIKKVVIARGIESIDEYAFYNCTEMTAISFVDETFVIQSPVQGQASIEIAEENVITAIKGNAFQGCSSLTSVTIPAGVETIGTEAFYNCSALTTLKFEENAEITEIGAAAFRSCTALEGVKIPASVTSLGILSFAGCSNLGYFEVEENSSLVSIEGQAFKGSSTAEGLELFTIDISHCSSLRTIGENAFREVGALKEIYLPKETTTFGSEAFYGCPNLEVCEFGGEESQLSGTLTATFRTCPKLKSIYIPAGVTCLYVKTFENCYALESIEFHPDSCSGQYDSYGLFTNTALKNVVFPVGFKSIGQENFMGCKELKSITLSEEITSIGDKAFQNCESLEAVVIPNTLTKLNHFAFAGCTSLVTVKFEEGNAGLSTVGYQVFQGCSKLEQVGTANAQGEFLDSKIPGVNGLSYALFLDCASLKEYTFAAEVNTQGEPFKDWNGNGIYEPGDPNWEQFTPAEHDKNGNGKYDAYMDYIPEYMFMGCVSLRHIYTVDAEGNKVETLPEYLTTIGQRAFEASGLETIVIPEKVTKIGYRAFQRIATLKSITFNCTNLTVVEGDAFQPFYTGEPFVDANENDVWDEGEEYTDVNGDGQYTMEQPVPSQLTKITFGANVTNINFATGIWANAVASHKALTTIEFLGDVPTITNMPEFTTVTTVIVPAGKLDAYKTAFAFYADKMVEAGV